MMKKYFLILLVISVCIISAETLCAPYLQGHYTTDQHSIKLYTQPENIPLNEFHTWFITIKNNNKNSPNILSISLDGKMPKHMHGLPTNPEIKNTIEGEFEIKGLKFQMAGEWMLIFTLNKDVENTVTHTFTVTN